jgi:hypothetical protein
MGKCNLFVNFKVWFVLNLGMAILVALSFFFLLVSENVPASARVSNVESYYAITMIQMTVSFFLNVLVLRFHHMTEEKVPEWVKVTKITIF